MGIYLLGGLLLAALPAVLLQTSFSWCPRCADSVLAQPPASQAEDQQLDGNIQQIKFVGLQRVSPETLRGHITSREGASPDQARIQRDVRALVALGWFDSLAAELVTLDSGDQLPHPNHPEGGMVFPKSTIDEIKQQTGRDLTRFDLDFDVPDQFLPEFPPPVYLTTRPDLGDVSQGKLVTSANYYELFNGILNPKQLEGLRLLLTPFPQQQFNATEDRRSEKASLGVACFDCHVNGHTNGATHLVGDIRPQEFRHRIQTPSLRGVNLQRLFGSQRASKSVEDFTEFEQRAAYFDGDPVTATKKGVNALERGSQVHDMAEFQELLDFPPAPKLDLYGNLDTVKATPAELHGQDIFFNKGKCASCHVPPYYTDNSMYNLRVERFYKPVMINGMMASADGPIKTFPLRGIKDSPPYLHDGRLLTLEDTVEFFNLILETRLTMQEKQDLVAFLRATSSRWSW